MNEKKIVVLKKNLAKLEEQYDKYPEHRFLRVQIISLRASINHAFPEYNEKIDLRSIYFIKQYLMSSKRWNDFELKTYCNTIHLFDVASIEELTYKLLNPFNYQLMTDEIEWMRNTAMVSLMETLVDIVKCDNVSPQVCFKKVNQYLQEHPLDNQYINEKVNLKYNIACFKYLSSERESLIIEMRDIIQSLISTNCDEYANAFIMKFLNINDYCFT